jgi:hypothetical protein
MKCRGFRTTAKALHGNAKVVGGGLSPDFCELASSGIVCANEIQQGCGAGIQFLLDVRGHFL